MKVLLLEDQADYLRYVKGFDYRSERPEITLHAVKDGHLWGWAYKGRVLSQIMLG